ncbi:MAG: hypothetical protein A3H57_01975 [Candidatus Taylorbacteria bacterium RIFCSPLOWO2_02_FULL_43_11]|uniref:EfeO-type cupredoxin-like domain-containing protein n=1 Tax=Candidatus Taylorbacteria bacterium RIFCSPHIGHO2_02_FULL_43_32b TaxID=1802306 RepID=A0A1G2MFE7_9BACT|nr:MAG: hypothetical protein A3C72_00660 [Candidatus Taylorbacteria bacterium RIFCSPHIGHO2_02_FULL_43_32b]OHA29513.1 MAG: hypothetical protein A3B08_01715 [Candidatus Taylorbacteria bacterium RIFCSPLOWO2_01_FULL_43_44]OHA37445.1 MAG: hypothetical protein A3H57_01975 [Candidatus Taylorbacteria bacterium RIFCSPLOWO2_02_FULL_43_11]
MSKKTILIILVVVAAIAVLFYWSDGSNPIDSIFENATSTTPSSKSNETGTTKTTSQPSTKTTYPAKTQTPVTNTNPGNVTPALPRAQINFTDAGFTPISMQVKLGQTIRFMNLGGKLMWIVPDSNYPEFAQANPVSRGEYWDFTFNKAGTWRYHNKEDASKTGTISVQY